MEEGWTARARGSNRLGAFDVPTSWVCLKQLFGRRYHNSVFRRTAVLLGFLLPAFTANFFVLYFASALLPPAEFGVFYVAGTFGNVLFSGSLILNMFFTRHLVSVADAAGEEVAFAAVGGIERAVVGWGVFFAAAIFAVMLAVATRFGVRSWVIVALMILDAYTSYVADIGRVFFQSVRRTALLGTYTLAWMVLRLALCLVGILVFGTAWGGLLGVVASSVLIHLGFRSWAAKSASRSPVSPPPLPSAITLVPAILGYGLLIAISNLDVLLSYVLLNGGDLGVYSAASIFPKAMLVLTMPLLQILFPTMIGAQASSGQSRTFVRQSGLAMLVVTSAGVGAIWLLSGWLCGGRWGVKLCEPSLMYVLLVSVVPLVLLRILVLLQFARGRDWFVLWLGLPAAAYLWAAASLERSTETMALEFSIFSAAAFVFFLWLHLGADRLRARRPA